MFTTFHAMNRDRGGGLFNPSGIQLNQTLLEPDHYLNSVVLATNKDGNRVAIGDDGVGDNLVTIMEYDSSTSTFQMIGYIDGAPYANAGGNSNSWKFGNIVRLNGDGNRLVIWDYWQLRIFDYDGTSWNESVSMNNLETHPHVPYGIDINLNGDKLIAAYLDLEKVVLYDISNSTPTVILEDNFSGTDPNVQYHRPRRVSISDTGDAFVLGITKSMVSEMVGGGFSTGKAFVYETNDNWNTHTRTAFESSYPPGEHNDNYYYATTLMLNGPGDSIVIGNSLTKSRNCSFPDSNLAGEVYIYKKNGTTWQEHGVLSHEPCSSAQSTQLGSNVCINDNGNIVVACGGERIYIFKLENNNWVEVTNISGNSTYSWLGKTQVQMKEDSIAMNGEGTRLYARSLEDGQETYPTWPVYFSQVNVFDIV